MISTPTQTNKGAGRYHQSFQSLLVTNFLTPISTQAYMPIIPSLLTELGEPVHTVGQLFFVLAAGAFVSFLLMNHLLSRVSTKTVLMADFAARIAAGLIWVSAMWPLRESDGVMAPLPGMRGTLSQLFLSRFFFGLTLNSFALANPWIGNRVENNAKPAAIAKAGGSLLLGIMLGPMVGIGVASMASTHVGGYMAIGWLTVILSALQLIITWTFFSDTSILADDKIDQMTKVSLVKTACSPTTRLLVWVSLGNQFLNTCTFLAGFESTLMLQVEQAYQWSLVDSLKVWIPMSSFGLIFLALVVPWMMDHYNSATVCTFAIAWSCGSVLGINWFDFSVPIPSWWFVIESIFSYGNSVVTALLSAIVAVRLTTVEQIQLASSGAIIGQVGRALGPIIATSIFESAEELSHWSKGAGTNFTRVYMFFVGSCPVILVLLLNFTPIIGSFKDPSPFEKRAAEGRR